MRHESRVSTATAASMVQLRDGDAVPAPSIRRHGRRGGGGRRAGGIRGRHVVLTGLGTVHRGLAGEWPHPTGVARLERLGVDLQGVQNHGFVVHPGDGRAPVTLPYAHGTAISADHHVLVGWMREAAERHPGITVRWGDRVTGVRADGSVTTSSGTTRANLVVGADGRASAVRRAVRQEEPPAAQLSSTAGFELTGVRLPRGAAATSSSAAPARRWPTGSARTPCGCRSTSRRAG